jgi:hypothetical protein
MKYVFCDIYNKTYSAFNTMEDTIASKFHLINYSQFRILFILYTSKIIIF